MQIRAVCVTSNNVSDAAVISDLLEQMPKDEGLESFTGDSAYDIKQVYEAVIGHGATPVIPPRKNARIHLRALQRSDCCMQEIEEEDMEVWSGYRWKPK